jgi:hypothetical protein
MLVAFELFQIFYRGNYILLLFIIIIIINLWEISM